MDDSKESVLDEMRLLERLKFLTDCTKFTQGISLALC